MEDRIRIKEAKVLSDDWSILKKTTLEIRRQDGSWQTVNRGGVVDHGEEIELVELRLDQALQMIETGEIQDGKTIMLLQHAKLKGLIEQRARGALHNQLITPVISLFTTASSRGRVAAAHARQHNELGPKKGGPRPRAPGTSLYRRDTQTPNRVCTARPTNHGSRGRDPSQRCVRQRPGSRHTAARRQRSRNKPPARVLSEQAGRV